MMQGLMAIYKKELSDHLSSYRFVILFALIAMIGFITTYMAGVHLRETLEGITKPKFVFLMLFNTTGALFSMVQFVSFFGPLIGLVLGFDAINRERAHETLIKLVSQPIYRDAVVNGKFLASTTTIAIMVISIALIISGLGLLILGVVPGMEEICRLAFYVMISIFYISFWLGVAILFSVFFKSIATSALAALGLWIFLSFFVSLGASVVADAVVSLEGQQPASQEMMLKNARIKENISLLSPMVLYAKASATIIDPMVNTSSAVVLMGTMERLSASRFQNPLPLGQSITVVSPYIICLIAVTLICFGITYTAFMLQEIRT